VAFFFSIAGITKANAAILYFEGYPGLFDGSATGGGGNIFGNSSIDFTRGSYATFYKNVAINESYGFSIVCPEGESAGSITVTPSGVNAGSSYITTDTNSIDIASASN